MRTHRYGLKIWFCASSKPPEFQNNGTWKKCYQSVIKTGGRNRKTVGMTGLFGFRFLFPLNRRNRLWAQIIAYPVDAGNFL